MANLARERSTGTVVLPFAPEPRSEAPARIVTTVEEALKEAEEREPRAPSRTSVRYPSPGGTSEKFSSVQRMPYEVVRVSPARGIVGVKKPELSIKPAVLTAAPVAPYPTCWI